MYISLQNFALVLREVRSENLPSWFHDSQYCSAHIFVFKVTIHTLPH